MARGYDPRNQGASPLNDPNPIPSPNSFGTPAAMPGAGAGDSYGAHDEWKDKNASGGLFSGNENYWDPQGPGQGPAQDKIYKKADGSYANTGGGGSGEVNNKVDFDWDSYLKDIEDLTRMTQDTTNAIIGDQGGPGVVAGRNDFFDGNPNDTWRNGSPGSQSAGSSMGGGSVYQGPVYDYPELNLPEPFEFGATLDLPDYKPPEYDEGKERSIRDEFIQTNKGALSEQAQSAILGSASVNNPQARGQIIRAALEGFSDALGQTALKGSQEGRRGAEAKYQRDVGVYNTQFDIQSQETVAKYNNDLKEDLMGWELEMTQATTDYNQNLSNWNSMPVDVKKSTMPGQGRATSQVGVGRRYI